MTAFICRAEGCTNWAMPYHPKENPKELCGACHELDEEHPVRMKRGPRPGRPYGQRKSDEPVKKGRNAA